MVWQGGCPGDPARARSTSLWDGLPAEAPELNPVEQLWANLRGNELANVACQGLAGVIAART